MLSYKENLEERHSLNKISEKDYFFLSSYINKLERNDVLVFLTSGIYAKPSRLKRKNNHCFLVSNALLYVVVLKSPNGMERLE